MTDTLKTAPVTDPTPTFDPISSAPISVSSASALSWTQAQDFEEELVELHVSGGVPSSDQLRRADAFVHQLAADPAELGRQTAPLRAEIMTRTLSALKSTSLSSAPRRRLLGLTARSYLRSGPAQRPLQAALRQVWPALPAGALDDQTLMDFFEQAPDEQVFAGLMHDLPLTVSAVDLAARTLGRVAAQLLTMKFWSSDKSIEALIVSRAQALELCLPLLQSIGDWDDGLSPQVSASVWAELNKFKDFGRDADPMFGQLAAQLGLPFLVSDSNLPVSPATLLIGSGRTESNWDEIEAALGLPGRVPPRSVLRQMPGQQVIARWSGARDQIERLAAPLAELAELDPERLNEAACLMRLLAPPFFLERPHLLGTRLLLCFYEALRRDPEVWRTQLDYLILTSSEVGLDFVPSSGIPRRLLERLRWIWFELCEPLLPEQVIQMRLSRTLLDGPDSADFLAELSRRWAQLPLTDGLELVRVAEECVRLSDLDFPLFRLAVPAVHDQLGVIELAMTVKPFYYSRLAGPNHVMVVSRPGASVVTPVAAASAHSIQAAYQVLCVSAQSLPRVSEVLSPDSETLLSLIFDLPQLLTDDGSTAVVF